MRRAPRGRLRRPELAKGGCVEDLAHIRCFRSGEGVRVRLPCSVARRFLTLLFTFSYVGTGPYRRNVSVGRFGVGTQPFRRDGCDGAVRFWARTGLLRRYGLNREGSGVGGEGVGTVTSWGRDGGVARTERFRRRDGSGPSRRRAGRVAATDRLRPDAPHPPRPAYSPRSHPARRTHRTRPVASPALRRTCFVATRPPSERNRFVATPLCLGYDDERRRAHNTSAPPHPSRGGRTPRGCDRSHPGGGLRGAGGGRVCPDVDRGDRTARGGRQDGGVPPLAFEAAPGAGRRVGGRGDGAADAGHRFAGG